MSVTYGQKNTPNNNFALNYQLSTVNCLKETDDPIARMQEYVDETTTHRYRSLRMWEQDARLFLGNLVLLPLAPLCQTDSPRDLLSQVAIEVANIEERQNTAEYGRIRQVILRS